MNIYLAGSCGSEDRTTMVNVAKKFRAAGLEVYCPFELKIDNAWGMSQEDWARKVFESDVAAIDSCDIFFMISKGRMSSAGVNWEQGYAFARGKNIYVLQITEEPTSLMTFCSTPFFYNTSPSKLNEKLDWLVNLIKDGKEPMRYGTCRTILT